MTVNANFKPSTGIRKIVISAVEKFGVATTTITDSANETRCYVRISAAII